MNSFEARYPGRCPACREPIKVGDPILDTEDGYVHDHCADAVDRELAKTPCTSCWLVHAGECM